MRSAWTTAEIRLARDEIACAESNANGATPPI